jgi:hypothetical protein
VESTQTGKLEVYKQLHRDKGGKGLGANPTFMISSQVTASTMGIGASGAVFIPDLLEPIHDELDIHVLQVQVNAISSRGLNERVGMVSLNPRDVQDVGGTRRGPTAWIQATVSLLTRPAVL